MEQRRIISQLDLAGGALAKRYAAMPFGYYKEVTYPYFGEILDLLGDGVRVLDVGAGCGHFACEFYRTRPSSRVDFTLIDSSNELLRIAHDSLKSLNVEVTTLQRSYNDPGWDGGLGDFDVIISHNSLFHLDPRKVGDFYSRLFALLKVNGLVLNQQSFAPRVLKGRFAALYRILGPARFMSQEDARRVREDEEDIAAFEAQHKSAFHTETKKLVEEGWTLDDTPAFASLDLSVEDHLRHLEAAGFEAACIWKMMHFAVLAAAKGNPF